MTHTGTQPIETARLILRPFTMEDCGGVFENRASDPRVQREYGEPVYADRAAAAELLAGWIGRYAAPDFYRWAVVEKGSGENLGQIAFCRVYDDCAAAEIEYCIGARFWGRGFSGEALGAVIDHAFRHTAFQKLEAFHRTANRKSGRVLEKSVMTVTDNVERFRRENKTPEGEVCYAVTRAAYLAKTK